MPTQDPLPEWVQQHRWDVGDRIRRLRRDRGLSQMQLAALAGLDHRTISRAENGQRDLGIDYAARIARGLGVPSWRLFRDDD